MKRAIRFIVAGGLGALAGWIIFEPWKPEYGAVRDVLLLYSVSIGIVLFLILERYVTFKTFKEIPAKLKTWPIYVIPLIGVILLKIIYGTYDQGHMNQDGKIETRFLLLDVSGSMRGRPMSELKKALNRYLGVLEEAKSQDVIGCITFESHARELYAPGTNYSRMKSEISRLRANGGTNMIEAFEMAYQYLIDANNSKEIILVSDGKPDDPQETIEYIEKIRGIRIHTVGVGKNYDRHMLQNIADRTGGTFFPADRISDLTNVFEKLAVQGLTETTSKGKARLPVLNRLLAWSLLGVCIGLAIGVGTKRKEMLLVGPIGGFLGGMLSSLLFTLLDLLHIDTGATSRMISFFLYGACLGLTIYLINDFFSRIKNVQRADYSVDEITDEDRN
ncbi:VWA domain-containing protein [candidate division KSB1 bacterium]|nr:VWA domain-containing protein [candidate division KSB1 bacterium]